MIPSNEKRHEDVPENALVLSFSQYSTLQTCTYQWYQKYVEGIPEIQSTNKYLVLGSILHNVLERSLKRSAGKAISLNDATNLVTVSIEREFEDFPEELSKDDVLFVQDRALKSVKVLSEIVKKYSYISYYGGVEKRILWEIPDSWLPKGFYENLHIISRHDQEERQNIDSVYFLGFIDLHTQDGEIIDWKTGRYTASKVAKYFKQIQTYAYILRNLGLPATKGKVVFVETGGEFPVEIQKETAKQTAQQTIRTVLDAYTSSGFSGEFKAKKRISAFTCGYCPYALRCLKETQESIIPTTHGFYAGIL